MSWLMLIVLGLLPRVFNHAYLFNMPALLHQRNTPVHHCVLCSHPKVGRHRVKYLKHLRVSLFQNIGSGDSFVLVGRCPRKGKSAPAPKNSALNMILAALRSFFASSSYVCACLCRFLFLSCCVGPLLDSRGHHCSPSDSPSLLPAFPLSARRAMGGSMPFQDALKARLDLMRPSRDMVARCLKEHPPRLSAGA